MYSQPTGKEGVSQSDQAGNHLFIQVVRVVMCAVGGWGGGVAGGEGNPALESRAGGVLGFDLLVPQGGLLEIHISLAPQLNLCIP